MIAALGSVVGLVDEGNLSGQGSEWRAPRVVERYTYDPYGKVFIERWDPQADEGNGAYVPVVEQHASGSNTVSSGLPYENRGTGGFEARGLAKICERAYPFPTSEPAVDPAVTKRQLRAWLDHRMREAAHRGTLAGGVR